MRLYRDVDVKLVTYLCDMCNKPMGYSGEAFVDNQYGITKFTYKRSR